MPRTWNRQRDTLINRYYATMLMYEHIFGVKSVDVHTAIDTGRLEETFEVTSWIIAINGYKKLTGHTGLPALLHA